MQFHENCSICIKLSNVQKTAERNALGYDHGVVFSKVPLNTKQNEIFQLIVEETVEKWAGALRIGVTTISPKDSKKYRALTDFFNPNFDTKDYWIWSGNKLHQRGKQKILKLSLHSLVKNDVIGVQVRSNGELHTYMHGNHLEMIAKGLPVDKDLFVVFDVYGATRQVSYVPGGGTLKDLCAMEILKHLNNPNELDTLPLPKTLIYYLKKRCSKNTLTRLKRKYSCIEEELKKRLSEDGVVYS